MKIPLNDQLMNEARKLAGLPHPKQDGFPYLNLVHRYHTGNITQPEWDQLTQAAQNILTPANQTELKTLLQSFQTFRRTYQPQKTKHPNSIY